MLRKSGVCLLALALLFVLTSCRKRVTASIETGTARPVAETISEVDALYSGRGDLNKVRQGLVALRQAQAGESASYELAWRLAKFNYYLGSHSSDETEREKAFREGVEAGKLAVKLQDGKPDGHFWLGANYGGNAQISMLSGLAEIDDIKREMETVLKLDEKYSAGSAYMVLGQVYLESPKLLGGDTQKAIDYFQKGIEVGPTNALLRWHLAEAYAEANRKDAARKEIEGLLAMKAEPGYEPEYKEAVENAQKLMAEKLR
jgi:tetratricopeptide (TPR) repeat protein